MEKVKDAAAQFLSNKRVAVTGVSRNPSGHGSNVVYQRLRKRGYVVYAVNPNADEVEGDPCYRDLKAIPGGVDAVVIATRPETAETTMRECADLGIMPRVDAPFIWERQRLRGGHQLWPGAGHRGDRRGLSADVRSHSRYRAQGDAVRVHSDGQGSKTGVSRLTDQRHVHLWAGATRPGLDYDFR